MAENKDTSVIPHGPYCYVGNKVCPYWSKHPDKDDQNSGYCSYLEMGDWMEDGTMFLWDQVKECGINMDEPDSE